MKQLLQQGLNGLIYSLVSLFLNVLFFVIFLLISGIGLILMPIILFMELKDHYKWMMTFLTTLSLIPPIVLAIAILTTSLLAYLLIFDPIKMFIMGMKYEEESATSLINNFRKLWLSSIQGYLIKIFLDFTKVYILKIYENLLSDKEIINAQGLIQNHSDPQKANKLQAHLNQYTKLLIRLGKLDQAMVDKDQRVAGFEAFKTLNYNNTQSVEVDLSLENLDFEDECVAYIPVQTPMLIEKQYQKNCRWRIVPKSTYITDVQNLKEWLEDNLTHPAEQDSLIDPDRYKGYESRYRWHLYEGKSQELLETAGKIRSMTWTL